MKSAQISLQAVDQIRAEQLQTLANLEPHLLIVFGSSAVFRHPELVERLRKNFPTAEIVGCSTAGEICNDGVHDGSVLINALHFEHPALRVISTRLVDMDDSFAAGERLGLALKPSGVHTVLVFAPGTQINGSLLIEGMRSQLSKAHIAGGLAGDGADFKQTYTLHNMSIASEQVVAVGLSSNRLNTGFGSYGGWKPFGPARKVTRSQHNQLFELDGEPALDVYKRYLGEHAERLPASGLLFPFSMLSESREEVGIIRTILAVDEEQGALVLAGDVVENGFLQLMHASTDALVDGAVSAAEAAHVYGAGQGFALLVSCVGRKLVMGGRTDEEVDAVIEVLGSNNTYAGFHSYGEISPGNTQKGCNLYNQTMTIAYLVEQ